LFSPRYERSTLIALAADEIRMDHHAVLRPIDQLSDQQMGAIPAIPIGKAVKQKDIVKLMMKL